MSRIKLAALLLATLAVGVVAGRSSLPPVAGRLTAEVDPSASLLSRRIADEHFDGLPLGDALNVLSRRAGTWIEVDWDAFSDGPDPTTRPVTAHLRDVTLDQALGALCLDVTESLARENPQQPTVTHVERDGQVVLTTEHRLGEFAAPRLYDVEPLIRLILKRHETTARLTRPTTSHPPTFSGDEDRSTLTRDEAVELLIVSVQETVDTNSWKDNGGHVGAIHEFSGLLFVSQTPRNHHRLAAFLNALADRFAVEPTTMAVLSDDAGFVPLPTTAPTVVP